MKITVEFDSEEEFKARIKNPRGKGKDEDDTPTGNAPAPLQPPSGAGTASGPSFQPSGAPGFGGPSFTPPTQQTGMQGVAPEVAGIVQRIAAKIDQAVSSGQGTDQALGWFRSECQKAGVDAAAATLEQIKTTHLFKLPVAQLQQIAGLMNA